MTTALLMILGAGACLGGWALLSLLGDERQRLLDEAATSRRRTASPPAPAVLAPSPTVKAATRNRPSALRDPAPKTSPQNASRNRGTGGARAR